MTKKMFFLLNAAIAVLLASALSSCEKDSYSKSDIEEKFFEIVDETHINTYDQLRILYEKNKEVSFKLSPQYEISVIDTLFVDPDETMERDLRFEMINDDAILEDGTLVYEFQYRCNLEGTPISDAKIPNKIRVSGILQEAPGSTKTEKKYLFCISDVILKATMGPVEIIDNKKTVKVLYELKCKELVLASTEQLFNIEKK